MSASKPVRADDAPPPLVLTGGEPAGIAPEITLAAWRRLRSRHPFYLLGDADHLATTARRLGLDVPIARIDQPAEALAVVRRALPVLHRPLPAPPEPGHPQVENAPAVIAAIEEGVAQVMAGEASALVTNPISKQVLKEGAGFPHPGHTEFLAALAGALRPVMMLAGGGLRVVPLTIHIPLAAVPAAVTPELIIETVRVMDAALRRDFAISGPRIAVAGLNPHAGEGGHMGREEIEIIAPALERLRAEGFTLAGPLPADTMFHEAARRGFDAALAMYHDQALIPIKTLAFDSGVNITLGLPFIRTSPDHGTAFDIAGKGIARPDSLVAALEEAARMARARRKERKPADGG